MWQDKEGKLKKNQLQQIKWKDQFLEKEKDRWKTAEDHHIEFKVTSIAMVIVLFCLIVQ